MKRFKPLLLSIGVVALMVVPAFAHATAGKAPRWQLSGAFLPTGAANEKAFTAVSSSIVTLSGSALNLTNPSGKCSVTGGKIAGSAAMSPGTGTGTSLTCTEVKVKGSEAKCTVQSVGAAAGEVVTKALKGTLIWKEKTGAAAGVLFEPASGTTFVEILVSGEECPVAKKTAYVVTGNTIGWFTEVAKEVEHETLTFPNTAALHYWNNEVTRVEQTIGGLKIGTASETLAGTASVALNPVTKVGVFEG